MTGNQALHLSARYSHDQLSRLLLKRGADPLSENKANLTPQHYDTGLQWFQATMEPSK